MLAQRGWTKKRLKRYEKYQEKECLGQAELAF
jgi:hypothetical protein